MLLDYWNDHIVEACWHVATVVCCWHTATLLDHLNDLNIDHEGYSMTEKHGWHVVMLLVLLAHGYIE